MGERGLVVSGERELAFEELAFGPLQADQVRIRTLFSGISAGTELSQYRGTSPFMQREWDDRFRRFRESGTPSWLYPVRNFGYEEVGEVVETGRDVTTLRVGDHVFGTWGHRTMHVWGGAEAAQRKLPPGADPRIGIFSHIGAVALNGVHDARIRMGDLVAVFGLGVPGQIVAQIARASGATVVGIDPVASRREAALKLGADRVLDPAAGSVADILKQETGGRGADICIEVSGAASACRGDAGGGLCEPGCRDGFLSGGTARAPSGRRIPSQPHRADVEPDLRCGARSEPPLEQAEAVADYRSAPARRAPRSPAAHYGHRGVRRRTGTV